MLTINFISILFISILPINIFSDNLTENAIIGKWMSTEKNVKVEVYKLNDEFRAKVIWFDDTDDPDRPMHTRKDLHNPVKELRNNRILGMSVLKNLKFNAKSNRWEDGIIYDANSGRHFSSVVYFNDEGLLEVKGFWKFEFLCQTIEFTKAD
ncbi:hypothetical protein A5893_04000 [Pedobacter psychrophilus]|uniref:DUF2147 domain-containing protein n=1 Tax=Pedobacter psychrophilus TaxID=1826909 RepID=A0A179DP37_9SPHI|nr:DUF2147 domain-containing protein [Pedobacter psychrophilus]OAQ42283.1 hypothetical protein A5893_04000 [Pedobacter psychrophilus]